MKIVFLTAQDLIVNVCKILLREFKFATLMYLSGLCNADVHHMVGVGKSVGSRT